MEHKINGKKFRVPPEVCYLLPAGFFVLCNISPVCVCSGELISIRRGLWTVKNKTSPLYRAYARDVIATMLVLTKGFSLVPFVIVYQAPGRALDPCLGVRLLPRVWNPDPVWDKRGLHVNLLDTPCAGGAGKGQFCRFVFQWSGFDIGWYDRPLFRHPMTTAFWNQIWKFAASLLVVKTKRTQRCLARSSKIIWLSFVGG